MPHLRLRIGSPDAQRRVPVVLTLRDGTEATGELDAATLTGDWSVDAIYAKLNDKDDRRQAEPLGKGLFDRLFVPGSDIRKAWNALALADRQLPLDLDIDSRALRAYPWELLWDDADRNAARVGGLVRRTSTAAQPSASSEWPFRLLLIVGVKDDEQEEADRIGAMKEVGLLKRTLVDFGRSIDVNVLKLPDQAEVQKVLGRYQPHAIHFIGHGTYDLGPNRHCLVIENPASTWNWTTTAITEDLTNANCVPRMVFVNCCRSSSERESNLSLQKALSDFGVPVVVAMQADVRGDKAAAFSKAFYARALVEPNDAAEAAADSPASVVDAMRQGGAHSALRTRSTGHCQH